MTTHKTSQQWRQLLLQRNTFSGTNIEFCQQHNVSITTYYKQRALLGKQQYQPSVSEQTSHATQSRFIQLKQTTTEVCTQTHQHPVLFNTRTGQLTLSADLATIDILTIIKGLMV
ncbi:IS66 family insertion sequence element accessory protein TnpB [Shewanella sp. SNU WT4]|uniref:IS66 family insertion sequence element accessory protein TnpB n=1 Tax=Shewanella sp. SNU WT4 TaxID=2590015 RepID=UPI00112B5276|nr:IS66 family insertion sequence element accessory protein TnpB [Shewanella sp. SNU WT4]QDF65694.1 IS66 family insertion sequence element accessory protein TnpB [Shewanella sp. SNU WT4]QDF65864.1 IS66 family insertion sequence element accessory protein TnpB [Shewanella sp. SNU WT4]QDF65873.1 IS66 family insertion sequence element accessory protein TnpB [Shewanella sp. SNU WT4]